MKRMRAYLMRISYWLGLSLLAACAGPSKQDGKGQVDDSLPPAIPLAAGKTDAAAKIVAVDLQSPHPYANNSDRVFALPLSSLPSCASIARLHFRVLRVEDGYDVVTVEPVGQPRQEFTGNHDNTWTEWFDIEASTANVRLESDGSITRHGFEIDQIEWNGAPASCGIVLPGCGAGMVDLARAPGTCECPVNPVCEPIANIEVSHRLALGFNRTTKTVRGATALYTHPGPADGPETDTVGSVDTARVAELVRRAAAQGLLEGEGYDRPVAAGVFYEAFTIKAGGREVTFAAGQGAHDPAVQQLIEELEVVFSCEGGGALTCGAGLTCEQNSCIEEQSCICTQQYDPVCGTNGQTYSNACFAGCADVGIAHAGECGQAGDMCGGLFGLPCGDAEKCRYGESTWAPPHPDAAGTCVAANYCDAPADCLGLPHIAVPGAWACNTNACAWQAGPAWQTFAGGHFESPSPYPHNVSVWKELYLPSGAQALRLRTARFATEAGYDKLEVWTWQAGAWLKVRTYSGVQGPALTDEFAGRYHYLRFVSDSSISASGFSLDAEYR